MKFNKNRMFKIEALIVVSATLFLSYTAWSSTTSADTTSFEKEKTEAATETTSESRNEVILTGGSNFSVILRDDGKLFAFGKNTYGVLGQSDTINRSYPIEIPSKSFNNEKIVDVQAHHNMIIVLTDTGKVYRWGDSGTKPALLYEDPNILAIELSAQSETIPHTAIFLLMRDGTIRVSGSSYYGQFSNGLTGYGSSGKCDGKHTTTTGDFSNRILLSATIRNCEDGTSYKEIVQGTETPLTNVSKMYANPFASNRAIALTNDNKLYIWGANSINGFSRELKNPNSYEITEIAYTSYPIFLTNEGRVYYYPSVSGNPVEITINSPDSPSPIVNIIGTKDKLLMLDANGRLYGIGPDNQYGNLGPNIPSSGNSYSNLQAAFTGIENVRTVGTGLDHTLIEYIDGSFATFGRNAYGELAIQDKNSKNSFTKVTELSNVSHVHATNQSSYASTEDNQFYSWGGNSTNYLLGRTGAHNTPGLVEDFSSIGQIEEIGGYSEKYTAGHILLSDSSLWVFDNSAYWGTGNPSALHFKLQQVINHNQAITGPDKIISAVQAHHGGAAVSSEGKLYSWGWDGYNGSYNLGLGYNLTDREGGYAESFQEVVAPQSETFVKVYGGENQRLALTKKGDVYAWGRNANNRFGASDTYFKVATKIQNLPEIKEVAVGYRFNLFLDTEGNVWSVGSNTYGSLGLGDTTSRNIPTKIPSLSNVEHIYAGDYSAFALLKTSELYSWGDNRYGQLSLGDTVQRNEPRLVSSSLDVKEVSPAREHTLLVNNSGDLLVTGSDGEGQLGLGGNQANPEPIPVIFSPVVSISNKDNGEYGSTDNLTIQGEIAVDSPNTGVDVTYTIESIKGKETFPLTSFISTSDPHKFSITLDLKNYEFGSYTVFVDATASNGASGNAALNFAVKDLINPTIQVDLSKHDKWATSPLSVNITADDAGGSGYRGYRYAITESSLKPTEWSNFIEEKNGTIPLNKTGSYYIHLEAYDNTGNSTYLMGGPYHLDLSPVFEFPSQIVFPSTKIGVQSIQPTSMDKEYLSYDHKEMDARPYSLRISMSEFVSVSGNKLNTTGVWNDIKKIKQDGTLEKTLDEVLLSNNPVELISVSETEKEIYSKLELPKDRMKLFIPIDVKLSSSAPESFTAEMIWDVSYTP